MGLNKNSLIVVLILIFLVAFNVSVFLLVDVFTTAFWVSVFFIHFAYMFLVLSFLLQPKGQNAAVLGYPIIYLCSLYFALAFVLGLIFILFKDASFKLAFIPQFIIAGFFGAAITSNLLANIKIESSTPKDSHYIYFIKNAVTELNIMVNSATDSSLKKRLEDLMEVFKYSQVTSHPALKDLESAIIIKLKKLAQFISFNDPSQAYDLIGEIEENLWERNARLG